MPSEVSAAFKAFPPKVRRKLEHLRTLILSIAAENQSIGPLHETLKWGEPAYLTEATGSGTTIRLGWPRSHPDHAAIYVNCQTTLISSFRKGFPEAFEYSGNRAILLRTDDPLNEEVLAVCIRMALTYHQTKPHQHQRNAPKR